MVEIKVLATLENLETVTEFIDKQLENCPMKIVTQINLAVEEIFVNIVKYAYKSEIGNATIRCEVKDNPKRIVIDFLDEGIPYNPMINDDPDITLSAEERNIGGLGIFMVKKLVNEIEYTFKDGKNILTIKKKI